MTELFLFTSSFVLVFALGLQSLNVNNGHLFLAILTSYIIGTGNIIVLKLAPDATLLQMFFYVQGGPFGICAAMWVHPRLAKILKRKKS